MNKRRAILFWAVFCILLALASGVFSGAAQAGAWPRGKGNVFVSSSASLTWPKGRAPELPDIFGSFYAEYGLRDALTLGVDAGTADMDRMDRTQIIGFLRYSLSEPSATHQFAIDLGTGMDRGAAAVRLGVSYGRGISLLSKNGWLSLDWVSLHSPSQEAQTHKLDATLGISLNRMKILGLLSAQRSYGGTQSATFTPSIVHQLGDKRHVELGATIGLTGRRDPALKIGVWQEF